MKKRVTIYDIAAKLGVSPTTVNKALNGKPKVSEATRKLILETANEMGFKPNIAAKSLARKPIKIGVIMAKTIPDFYNMVLAGAKTACNSLSDFNVTGEYIVIDNPDRDKRICDKMLEMADRGFDGIVLSADENELFFSAIRKLREKNIHVATVVTDIENSERNFSLRHDGKVAGKMACQLLSLLIRKGKVVIFTGNKDIGIHRENISGFKEQIKNYDIDLVKIYENRDNPELAYKTTLELLDEYPDIDGIYINSANSEGVCKVIESKNLAGKIKIVASDFFPSMEENIKKGIVDATIFQDPFNEGRLVFKYLYQYIAENRTYDSNIFIKPKLIMESNLELYKNYNNIGDDLFDYLEFK